jgi:type VI protein secretion system component Hcp
MKRGFGEANNEDDPSTSIKLAKIEQNVSVVTSLLYRACKNTHKFQQITLTSVR